ncbi:MAG TPA: hypothetical protein VJV78_07000 [Polyangiales bacterium]|nr:hypothetical protein [Polyangiales bacterium]
MRTGWARQSRDGSTLFADGTLALGGTIASLPKSSALYPGREDGNP